MTGIRETAAQGRFSGTCEGRTAKRNRRIKKDNYKELMFVISKIERGLKACE
ncbi:MAG: hypothetical protein PHR14_11025 [Oscillospiraceae bacterium]|nr:hypothetical protein [Oscillospiraceae bacterium]